MVLISVIRMSQATWPVQLATTSFKFLYLAYLDSRDVKRDTGKLYVKANPALR